MATLRSAASWKKWRGRKKGQRGPAPELHPPGFSGGQPQVQGHKIEPRSEVERRYLHAVTAAQVRGQATGVPNVARSDWDRVKLAEARWAQGIIERRRIKIAAIEKLRSVKPAFRDASRVVKLDTKRAEADTLRSGLERQLVQNRGAPHNTPPPPPSGASLQAGQEVRQESAFMAGLRARAKERAEREMDGIAHGFERDRKRER